MGSQIDRVTRASEGCGEEFFSGLLEARREEYRINWDAAVAPLAPELQHDAFEEAWTVARDLVQRVGHAAKEVPE